MTSRSRELGRNLALAAASLLATFIALEIAVRLLLPVADIPWHVGDPHVGYRLRPNQAGRWFGEGVSATFRVNAQGFNNEHDYGARTPGRQRIAILGDSYVENLFIDRGRRFFDLLEKKLDAGGRPAEIFTFGLSGYGTGQELLLLEHDVEPLAPDLVILLFIGNDLGDTACSLNDDPRRTCFSLDERGLPVHRPPEPHAPNPLARVAMSSALARYLAINRDLVGWWRGRKGGPVMHPMAMAHAVSPPPAWEEAWNVVEACLQEVARRCASRGIPLLVIDQPVMEPSLVAAIASLPGGGDTGLPRRRLQDLAQREGFRFFDLRPAFSGSGAIEAERWLNAGIGHWNQAAQDAVAAALVQPVAEILGGAGERVGRRQPRTEGAGAARLRPAHQVVEAVSQGWVRAAVAP